MALPVLLQGAPVTLGRIAPHQSARQTRRGVDLQPLVTQGLSEPSAVHLEVGRVPDQAHAVIAQGAEDDVRVGVGAIGVQGEHKVMTQPVVGGGESIGG